MYVKYHSTFHVKASILPSVVLKMFSSKRKVEFMVILEVIWHVFNVMWKRVNVKDQGEVLFKSQAPVWWKILLWFTKTLCLKTLLSETLHWYVCMYTLIFFYVIDANNELLPATSSSIDVHRNVSVISI